MRLEIGVKECFPTPIWTLDLPPDQAAVMNAGLLNEIERLIEPRPALKPGTNWQTDPILQDLPEFADLKALILTAAGAVGEALKLKSRQFRITGCWANVNPPGGRNSAHTHPNNYLSGVYYVATPAGQGRIVFDDPRPQAFVMMPPVSQFTKFTGNNVNLDVKPGRLVLFPSWLQHSVPTNQSTEDRVTIAFNLMFEDYVDAASPPLWQGTVKVDQRS
ncbi:conserved hypothetical protein [Arboricoccus pini]|uniref:Uncharacterized protein n=1 Tax=Arboricoccus pini TaxID=1963835 RepID=A0A212QW54_9PROT|nr:TIGR02466 family protein [Arboricoccus pini]SNB63957.1 conserved hypothetical protein [Arboricoccus pini]